MRTLKFIVNSQIIERDPTGAFSGLIPGTTRYLQAEFSFSSEWNGTARVAGFASVFKEFPATILEDGKTCMIPAEALVGKRFKVYVVGKKDNLKLTTNKVEVIQNGGKG